MALTLLQLRTRVKERYERNGSSNDASTALLNMFVNDALREAINTVGDDAWFMRQSATVTFLQYPALNTLPPDVRRVYRIEDETNAPGTPIAWDFIKHSTEGYVVIVTQRAGDFTMQYLARQVGLVGDSDTTPFPDEHAELIVAMACKRLADAVGNASLSGSMAGEVATLLRIFKRDCLKYGGMRHGSMTTIWSNNG